LSKRPTTVDWNAGSIHQAGPRRHHHDADPAPAGV
jgi:hypothetical protein